MIHDMCFSLMISSFLTVQEQGCIRDNDYNYLLTCLLCIMNFWHFLTFFDILTFLTFFWHFLTFLTIFWPTDRPSLQNIGKSQKMFFEADLNPKKVPNGPKSAKKTPIVAQLKTKDGAVHSHNHSCNSSHFQSQLFRVCRCTSHVYI